MKKQYKGITLIELLVILSVLAILTGFSWPSFQTFANRVKADATRNTWTQLINYSRRAAVDSQSDITFCPYDEITQACSTDSTRSWAVFTDQNADEKLNDGDTLLKLHYADPQMTFQFYPATRFYIRYTDKPTGIYSGHMRGLTICPNGQPDIASVHLRINIMGRVAASQSRDAEGIILRESGSSTYEIKC